MTAINAILKRDRAILMTDAALYTPQGDVLAFGLKTFSIPNLKAAIAIRGAQRIGPLLVMEMAMVYQSFDDLLTRIENDLRAFYDAALMALADAGMPEIEIYIVGWSDADNCAKGCTFSSAEDDFEYIDGFAIGPDPEDEVENLWAAKASVLNDWTEKNFDPIRHGIPFMEAQRRLLLDVNGRLAHIVGGHILLTEITRDGVSQRVIHRWSYKAGEPIRPAPFAAPSATKVISRHQRRSAARKHRKLA